MSLHILQNPLQNYNKTILSEDFYNTLLFPKIETNLKRQLKAGEKDAIRRRIEQVKPELLVGKSTEKILASLTNLSMKLYTTQNNTDIDDIKQYLIEEIHNTKPRPNIPRFKQSDIYEPIEKLPKEGFLPTSEINLIIKQFLGGGDLNTFKRALEKLMPSKTINKTYLFLDTRYRILDYDPPVKYKWGFFQNYITQQGTTNSITSIRNAIAIKVLPIRIPNQLETNNGYGRINMFIEEYSTQTIIDNEGGKHHFEFAVAQDGGSLDLTPYKLNRGIFYFNQILSDFNTITISFRGPVKPIRFLPDRAKATTDYGNPAIITTDIPHNLLTGDLVSFENFRTNDPTILNSVIELMANDNGIPITYISPTQFSIPINLSSLLYLRVYYYKNVSGIAELNPFSNTVVGSETKYQQELTGGGDPAGDFVMIEDSYNNLFFSHINSVFSDTTMTLSNNWIFSADSQCGIFKMIEISGDLVSIDGSKVITGNNTLFKSEFAVGDYIIGDTFFLGVIEEIVDNQLMYLEMPSEFTVVSNKLFRYKPSSPLAIVGLVFDVYFHKTRMHIPIEVMTIADKATGDKKNNLSI